LTETDDEKISKRLIFVKNLYRGDSLKEAANRVGKSESTGSRWARRWNEGGLGLPTPSFEGGCPRSSAKTQQELLDIFRDGQPWKSQETQHLLNKEFDIEYHPVYFIQFLDGLGLFYSTPRPKRPSRPDDAEEILDERVADALDEADTDESYNKYEDDNGKTWVVNNDIYTDGGTAMGSFDVLHPQLWDNPHRLWYVDDPHIE